MTLVLTNTHKQSQLKVEELEKDAKKKELSYQLHLDNQLQQIKYMISLLNKH